MFSLPQEEHKHLVEHQDAGKRVTQRLHEMVRTSCAPSGFLQYGRHPIDPQAKHLSGHTIL